MKQPAESGREGFSRRSVLKVGAMSTGALLIGGVGTAAAYTFPSTNDQNRSNGLPHIDFVSEDNCEVTLEFVNDTNSLTYFEYRQDGVEPDGYDTPHPVVDGSVIYPGVSVDGRGESEPVTETMTLSANEVVEVRLALGGERDWDFDWTPFYVECNPESKEDCKDGAWQAAGFRNQGQCIRYVETGKDSR